MIHDHSTYVNVAVAKNRMTRRWFDA